MPNQSTPPTPTPLELQTAISELDKARKDHEEFAQCFPPEAGGPWHAERAATLERVARWLELVAAPAIGSGEVARYFVDRESERRRDMFDRMRARAATLTIANMSDKPARFEAHAMGFAPTLPAPRAPVALAELPAPCIDCGEPLNGATGTRCPSCEGQERELSGRCMTVECGRKLERHEQTGHPSKWLCSTCARWAACECCAGSRFDPDCICTCHRRNRKPEFRAYAEPRARSSGYSLAEVAQRFRESGGIGAIVADIVEGKEPPAVRAALERERVCDTWVRDSVDDDDDDPHAGDYCPDCHRIHCTDADDDLCEEEKAERKADDGAGL